MTNKTNCGGILASSLVILAFVFSIFWKKVIQRNIINAVNFKPDSDSFKKWHNSPINNIGSYHLFNITNPIEIVHDPTPITINVKEIRAYTYNIKTSKTNIKWSNDYRKLSYGVEQLFIRHPTRFDPSSVHDTGVFIDLVRAIFRASYGHKPSQAFYALTGMNTFYYRNAVEQLEDFNSDLFEIVREKMTGPNTVKSGFTYRRNGSQLYNISIYIGTPLKAVYRMQLNIEAIIDPMTQSKDGSGFTSIERKGVKRLIPIL
ncbi:unnamed protein product [Rotaria socialis]|uniref:Scavenger receptor class B member 1 n=1 Tax=Rotaria socialis TaxID=392032 RepID=A0A818C242_9BILA|nr:unnamed protein product [Rotaria socialis]CAF3402165.1 unnamed protein product [Rotaria socialis]CAF3426100.1 unnamed protein product [Rotaria socialis]CAF4114455.1 unnamed protein product [Rotaria socialis]CAF4279022.1 unnamed protein product [Rotaria socialis]